MPGIVASGLANPLGVGANLANPRRRAMIERHLRRVNPRGRACAFAAAVQKAFESYARYWVESFRLPSLSARAVADGIEVPGYEQIVAARQRGTGAILALPHLGGWEWAGRWLADVGNPVTVVVERVEPPELFEWFADLRGKLGMTVVALGPDAGRATLQALKRNEIVCLLSDRNIGGGGVEVEFFGERTDAPAGPATLALRTGAPIFPVAVYFNRQPRAPRRRSSAAAGGAAGFVARRRHAGHATPRRRTRTPHPPGPRAVAPVPAELAERPWIWHLTCGSVLPDGSSGSDPSTTAGGLSWRVAEKRAGYSSFSTAVLAMSSSSSPSAPSPTPNR